MNQNVANDYNRHPFLKFMVSPKMRVWRHVSLFAIIFLLDGMNADQPREAGDIRLITFGVFMLLIYVNIYVFVPRFLFRQRYVFYALATLGTSAFLNVFLVWKDGISPPLNGQPLQYSLAAYLGITFFILIFFACSAAIKLFQRSVIDYYRINQLEKYTLNAELEQLKSQINPHFLFNTLNNVNVLTKKDPEKASDILHKLSDLLRYQLYDSAHSRVALSGDIEFLNNLLELEKIRRDHFTFIIEQEGVIPYLHIPPFLFVPFVENAVKHNADAIGEPYVHIRFYVRGNRLFFECRNSKPLQPPVPKKAGGLGLNNIRRRLDLLYPDTHTLTIDNQADTYTVQLSIPIT